MNNDQMSFNAEKNGRTGKKRLWVVTEVYYPEVISTGYYLTSIAEGLQEDFDVNVLCGQPNYAARGTIAPKRENRNGVEIFRASSTTLDKNVIVFRLINMVTLGIAMFAKSLRNFRKGDRILVVTAPPSLPFTTALAALIKGSSYTLLLHDSYPEILVAVGKLKRGSLFATALNFCNRWLFKYTSKVIVVGRDMNELVTKKTAGLDLPIVTIPNWADLEGVHPTERKENILLEQLGLSGKFVFMYAGNIGHPTDLESIIECAERLSAHDHFHFVFIGSGAKKSWLQAEIESRNLANVSILEPRPRSEQIVFLNACDIGLISLVQNMWGTAMPSRTYNILAAGKPILALTDNGSELSRVIDEENVGWHVPPGDPDLLFDTILDIYARKGELAEMGNRARGAALNKYSLKDAVDKYRAELR
ncbi:MAG: glycosyltransferase family 4 protein [Saprospiraceae bacterium]|nr:glycosyltransferase family 4 protein [Pyrinomonadaceae bacterium]